MSTTLDPLEEPGSRLSAVDIAAFVDRLADADVDGADAANIDELAALERLKSACSARQARVTHHFAGSQLQAAATTKRDPDEVRRSIASQVALARKDSPVRGNRHVGFAKAMVEEMPHTFQALQDGRISEWRATLLVRETACLSLEHRGVVDAELADRLGELGDKQTAGAAARIGQRLDPQAWVKRYRKAVSERRVSIRPAPDLMTYVTAFLPMAQGVAVYAALSRHADCARATGDDRGRGQIMADEFVARATRAAVNTSDANGTGSEAVGEADAAARRASDPDGPVAENGRPEGTSEPADVSTAPDDPDTTETSTATGTSSAAETVTEDHNGETAVVTAGEAPAPAPDGFTAGTNIDIQLIMTDRTLFDGDNEPAHVTGYGPIPAPLARRLLRDAGPNIKAWVRRLYTDPDTNQLITGDSRSRFFTHSVRQFIIARDQICRTPYCDAPIRHIDHVVSRQHDGQTEIANGQGKCERCNYVKESAGWASTTDPDTSTVTITTPTGHTYNSQPPPPPQSTPWQKAPATTGPPPGPSRKTRPVIDIIFPEQRYKREIYYVP